MESRRLMLAIAALASMLMLAAPAAAFVGVGGAGGLGNAGMGAGNIGRSGNSALMGGQLPNPSGNMGPWPRSAMSEEGSERTFKADLRLSGRLAVDPSSVPPGASVVRLRMDGKLYPLVLDSRSAGADIETRAGYSYTTELYRAALVKECVVVGAPSLRTQIANSGGSAKPIQVEGYLFNRTSPYFVVRSVSAAQ